MIIENYKSLLALSKLARGRLLSVTPLDYSIDDTAAAVDELKNRFVYYLLLCRFQ